MATDEAVERYREQFRREEIGKAYRGGVHLAFTSLVSLAVLALCIASLDQVKPLEWLTLPAVFIYANLVEYLGHRYPMHHPVRGLKILFFRHTKQHHRFFTHKEMTFADSRDYKAVLFPPEMIVFFLGGFGVPMWLILYYTVSANVAWLAVAMALGYFLNYEWLHFAYHCDPGSRIGRIPGLQTLRNLHLHHHDPRLMTHFNFNITYPIADWIFRTLYDSKSQQL
ncbi:fatty acid hydroxylase family protein [Pseudomonadota bacterium]